VIWGDRTAVGVGGGVCQVSTTVFRTAYEGGFPIVQRYNHGYVVGWYGAPGMDATIFTPSVDFKFRNDTGAYLLLEPAVDSVNGVMTFNFYGTRPDRTVSVSEPEITDVKQPEPPQYVVDETLGEGEQKQVEWEKEGMTVKVRRTIVEDGTTRTDTLVSNYQPWQAVYLVGPGVEIPATPTPEAGGERILNGTDVILATGSRVKSLPGLVPDGRRIVTSDDVLRMDSMPSSVIVVGAGAVGVEFASLYHDLGASVQLLEYLPAIVPLEDAEVSKELERSFTRRGIKVMTGARFDASSVIVGEDGVRMTVGPEGGEAKEIAAEMLLVATGRATNVEDVGLETTTAEVDRGFVKVDGHMRTREPHLYAIGDIVGGLMLAHTAAHEGIIAAHVIAGETDVHPMDYVKQPRATYSRPEIASVGLTQQQCEDRGLPTKIAKVPFQAIGKALIGGEYEGFAKIIGHRDTDETLGIHLIGPHATDLIAEASLALSLEATPWEIGAATHAHPTYSEILAEVAMAVDGRSINF
jgi:dihydrolipoamide dehydrogenase